MKKILLATTMLAGTAGFAAAEVTATGYAEIGILSSEGFVGALAPLNGQITFHQDVEVTFRLTGESDSGLSFGAVIDLDETNVALLDDSGTTVFVSGAFGTLTMGDTDGAFDWALQDAGSLTSMGDDHTTHVGYFNSNGFDGSHDGQIVRYEYSFGDFAAAISYEQAGNGAAGVALDDNVAIGATYSTEMAGTSLRFGVGYITGAETPLAGGAQRNADEFGLTVGAELAGGFSGMIGYTQTSFDAVGVPDEDRLGLGLTYTTGALSVHMNYGEVDAGALNQDSYGMAVNYDLGGGAVVMAGYGSDVSAAAGDQTQYSIGLGLSF